MREVERAWSHRLDGAALDPSLLTSRQGVACAPLKDGAQRAGVSKGRGVLAPPGGPVAGP